MLTFVLFIVCVFRDSIVTVLRCCIQLLSAQKYIYIAISFFCKIMFFLVYNFSTQ